MKSKHLGDSFERGYTSTESHKAQFDSQTLEQKLAKASSKIQSEQKKKGRGMAMM